MAKILAFAGSARKRSFNKRLLKIAAAGAEEAGADVTVADLADFPMPLFNGDLEDESGMPEHAARFKDLMLQHDALLIASPEYNSAFTPLLKNTLDWASRATSDDEPPLAAFDGKYAAIMACSPGGLGGIRGLVFLRMMLGNIGVTVLPEQQAVPGIMNAFNDDGSLADERKNRAVRSLGAKLARVVSKALS